MAKKGSTVVKLTEEEINVLKKINASREAIKTELYQIGVARINIEQREENIKTKYIQNETFERQFAQTLQEKYGPGSVDLESGMITLG